MGISYQKKLESLEEKKAVHTSCKHGVRRICQLYTKGGPAGKLMWCEPPRDHLDYRRRDNIQRSSPQNTGRAKTVTTLRLEECDFGHALGARGGYSHTLAIRVCAAQRGRDFEAPWAPGGSWLRTGYPFQRRFLERGIKNCGSRLYLLLKIVADYEEVLFDVYLFKKTGLFQFTNFLGRSTKNWPISITGYQF